MSPKPNKTNESSRGAKDWLEDGFAAKYGVSNQPSVLPFASSGDASSARGYPGVVDARLDMLHKPEVGSTCRVKICTDENEVKSRRAPITNLSQASPAWIVPASPVDDSRSNKPTSVSHRGGCSSAAQNFPPTTGTSCISANQSATMPFGPSWVDIDGALDTSEQSTCSGPLVNQPRTSASTSGRGPGRGPGRNNQPCGEPAASISTVVTTVMIRNIPNKFKNQDLMEKIDVAGFSGMYDYLYVPIEARGRSNIGYAFVNFLTQQIAEKFMKDIDGYRFGQVNSTKRASCAAARVQGLEANIEHYRASFVQGSGAPIVFQNGQQVIIAPSGHWMPPKSTTPASQVTTHPQGQSSKLTLDASDSSCATTASAQSQSSGQSQNTTKDELEKMLESLTSEAGEFRF